MAPITRRTKAAGEAHLLSRKSKHSREESWEFLEQNQTTNNPGNDQNFSFRSSIVPPDNDALQPLRTMADRVGKEVEKFSEIMDNWYHQVYQVPVGLTREQEALQQYRPTVRLVSRLRDQAVATVNSLKRRLAKEDLKQQASELRARLHNQRDSTSFGKSVQQIAEAERVGDLRQWEAEEATWELAALIIPQRYSEPGSDPERERREKQAKIGKVHRYMSEEDVWQSFLLHDDRNKEKHIVRKWLQHTLDRKSVDIDQISKELEAEDPTHKGLTTWSLGWMNTREKIKADKRLNSWSRPVEPGDIPLIGGDRGGRLVTQLDPDAPLRQGRSLEGADSSQEHYVWLVCYDLLRRGKSWKEIREWFEDRNEHWRGVTLGMAGDQNQLPVHLSGPDRGVLWRRLCSTAAKAANDPYERAVYGLLGGDLQSILPLCRTWEDHLFAQCNCEELADLDSYVQKAFHRAQSSNSSRSSIKTLSKKLESPIPAQETMQLIQESIIENTFEELVYNVGLAIANVAHADGAHSNLIQKCHDKADQKYMPFTEDPQALRVLVHLLCAFGRLGMRPKTTARHAIIENVIIGYVDFLRLAGKLDLLPLYASQLREETAERTLGRICIEIMNPTDQRQFVKLMYQKLVEVDKVLTEQYTYTLNESGLDGEPPIAKYEILEDTSDMEEEVKQFWPSKRIREGLLQGDLNEKEAAIVESLGWYMHINKGWHITFRTLSDALATFLAHGKVEAAVTLCERFSTREISLTKSPQYLADIGIDDAVDVTEWSAEQELENQMSRRSTRASSKKPQNERTSMAMTDELKTKIAVVNVLKRQSALYCQLEQLVIALHALREWRDAEDFALDAKVVSSLRKEPNTTSAKASTKDSFERLRQAMEPLLAGNFLVPSTDAPPIPDDNASDVSSNARHLLVIEAEASRLRAIRHAYLPEIILAYLSALQSSAFLLTRENFVYAMDLAASVAAEENEELSKCFVESGRMAELVEGFAQVSMVMLKVGAGEGKGRARHEKKRGWEGETLRIWDLGFRN